LSKVDREALQRAIEMVRAEGPNETRWIDDHFRTNGFFETGRLASYHCQYRALQLKPWEFPPIWIDDVSEAFAALTRCRAFDVRARSARGARTSRS
jgi:hypothetical protein